jgi:putative (di)nucleoside polyphosphate hydrolase
VFVAQRLDSTLEAWQMPQGGLDEGEEPLEGARSASWRRRPASAPTMVEIVARARRAFYDLPEDLVGKLWKGKWRGQRQTWFLAASSAPTRT